MVLRPMDREILALAKQSIGGEKKKDALPGQPYKVNLYQDAGRSTPNRLKVDLDRDDKWDEKWTFEEGGRVVRQVAPADDERYTETWVRHGDNWLSPALLAGLAGSAIPAEREPAPGTAAPADSGRAPGPAAPAGEGTALRPFDNEVLALGSRSLSGEKVKDALPGKTFKVNLYQDAGKTRVNRLKIDLDRDDKWDEKWTFEEEGGRVEVKRQIAPADDEQYIEEYRLRAGRWVRKK